MAAWPEYETTRALDVLRATEYSRLDRLGHIYLDYTGAGLNAICQVREHQSLLDSHVFGNPHSQNPTSATITAMVQQCRRKVLDYFHAAEDECAVIFTPNASGALKLVGESYPFGPDSHYLLTFDHHNSVNGIREFARSHRATTTYVPLTLPEMRVDEDALGLLLQPRRRRNRAAPVQARTDRLLQRPRASEFALHPGGLSPLRGQQGNRRGQDFPGNCQRLRRRPPVCQVRG